MCWHKFLILLQTVYRQHSEKPSVSHIHPLPISHTCQLLSQGLAFTVSTTWMLMLDCPILEFFSTLRIVFINLSQLRMYHEIPFSFSWNFSATSSTFVCLDLGGGICWWFFGYDNGMLRLHDSWDPGKIRNGPRKSSPLAVTNVCGEFCISHWQ